MKPRANNVEPIDGASHKPANPNICAPVERNDLVRPRLDCRQVTTEQTRTGSKSREKESL